MPRAVYETKDGEYRIFYDPIPQMDDDYVMSNNECECWLKIAERVGITLDGVLYQTDETSIRSSYRLLSALLDISTL